MKLNFKTCFRLSRPRIVLMLLQSCFLHRVIGDQPVAFMSSPPEPLGLETNCPVLYWSETYAKPVPLALHIMRADTRHPDVDIVAAVAPDPDGDGPAQAALIHPVAIASNNGLVAAVNANAFAGPKDANGKENRNWLPGLPVTFLGWVASGSRTINPPNPSYWSVWVAPDRAIHIAPASHSDAAIEAVAGFGGLIREGKIIPSPTTADQRHPRTAVGIDQAGRYLIMLVADGRQPGYSDGMTTRELAEKMAALGCWDAANLDGGGSSVMLATDPEGILRILNRPSDRGLFNTPTPRPVPVLIGIRIKTVPPGLHSQHQTE